MSIPSAPAAEGYGNYLAAFGVVAEAIRIRHADEFVFDQRFTLPAWTLCDPRLGPSSFVASRPIGGDAETGEVADGGLGRLLAARAWLLLNQDWLPTPLVELPYPVQAAPFDRAILALDPAKTGHDDQRLTASGRVCQAVPAPGSKVTLSALNLARAGSGA